MWKIGEPTKSAHTLPPANPDAVGGIPPNRCLPIAHIILRRSESTSMRRPSSYRHQPLNGDLRNNTRAVQVRKRNLRIGPTEVVSIIKPDLIHDFQDPIGVLYPIEIAEPPSEHFLVQRLRPPALLRSGLD